MKSLPPPNPSAMLPESSGIFARLGRTFDQVNRDEGLAERLRPHAEAGTLVYVMRTRSLLDYLFFNHLFLKLGLPLAQIANGVDLSFFRGLRAWLGGLWARLTGGRGQGRCADEFAAIVAGAQPALLFLKTRTITGDRVVDPDILERLIALQRTQDQPILLLPQHIVWPRRPPSQRRRWRDILFGSQDSTGRLSKMVHFFLGLPQAVVQVGEPIDLARQVAQHEGWSDERLARKVRRVLFIHLAREAMAIHGPKVKEPHRIRREILERKAFQTELKALARTEGLAWNQAYEQARRDLKEIAAATRFEFVLGFGKLLDVVFGRIFDGVEVDEPGMRRVKDAARLSRRAPLVLVPSHKSHLDYLVISWVFLRREFIPPHIAAGANLSFFPLGFFLRRAGAFFLRRSFHGMPLYKAVFRRYVWKLVREGYPLEFFPEGGRSRTGKLLPPKMGMMAMLLEGVRAGEFKDLQFVPINLSYEKVVETASYSRELTGGTKKAESVGGVVRAGGVVLRRYGRIYVNFEAPVRLSDYLAEQGLSLDDGTPDDDFRDTTRRLAYHLMRQIQEATIVPPSALIGAVLLSHDRRGMSVARLRERVGFLVDLLERRGARLSASIRHRLAQAAPQLEAAAQRSTRDAHRARGEALRPLLDEAMGLLKKLIQRVDAGGDVIYTVPERARIELDYYRNTVLGILAPEALLATALLAARRPVPYAQLASEVSRLSDWFKLEFIYPTSQPFEANFEATLVRLEAEGFVGREGDTVVASAPKTLEFFAGMLRHLVEGYWIAADALRGLAHGPMEKKEWLEYAREHAEREFLEGDVSRQESASTAVLGNALELFRQEALVVEATRPGGRKPVTVYRLAPGRGLDDVAFRRDDLGFFLNRQRDAEPAPAEARVAQEPTAEAADQAPSTVPPAAPPEDVEPGAPEEEGVAEKTSASSPSE
ncbi:MAG: 1-acyl-sn-glycerol-3-phosphate acyltransferase [Myxococcales bacterium]|nr:1-acyl-sn-glycerol-3-phosphate acyltransferase [Myxococcales bacterium]MCB9526473.1 1-acyl-sn-glycerol-3-phosphate acyltransferase [Myxococcales bacterium]